MHTSFARLALLIFALMAASVMSAAASTTPVRDLTPTLSPALTPTPTGPPPRRGEQPPTVMQPGRLYEGNYFGVPVEFTLEAELGQFMIIEATHAEFDAVLEIMDAEGTQVAYDDDSGTGNLPQVIFIAPSNGTFTVKLRGYSDPVEGSYIVSAAGTVAPLPIGESVDATFDGGSSVIYAFEAEQGDVVNIVADSDDSIDTTLRLIGPDGVQIGYVDDFTGVDPEFRRQPIDNSGTHYLIHSPYSESSVGDVSLSIEKTEIVSLGAEPAFYAIEQGRDVFNVEAQAGKLYLVTMTAGFEVSGTLDVIGLDGVSAGLVSFTNVEGASLMFRADADGVYRLNVTQSNTSASPDAGIYLSVLPTGQ